MITKLVENEVKHLMFARRRRPLVWIGRPFKLVAKFFPLSAGEFLFFSHGNKCIVKRRSVKEIARHMIIGSTSISYFPTFFGLSTNSRPFFNNITPILDVTENAQMGRP